MIIPVSERLKEIRENSTPVGTHSLWYQGELRSFNVYEVDLSLLKYNHLNGRILSLSTEYAVEHGIELADLDTSKRQSIIANWIWNKNKSKNELTYEDLKLKGQIQPGVVTSDGLIVDGNRRFMLLSRLQNSGESKKFKTVILNDTYTSGGATDIDLDIKRLETSIQMGMDEKLDYDAIEKYLKIKDLMSLPRKKMPVKEIATMMNYKKGKSSEPDADRVLYLYDVCKMMDRYLKFFGMPDMYSTIQKQEDLFQKLVTMVNLYKSGKKTALRWTPSDDEIEEYIIVCFYTIRYIYNKEKAYDSTDPKTVRDLLFKNSKKGVFADKTMWNDYKTNVKYDTLHEVIKKSDQNKAIKEYTNNGIKLSEAYTAVNKDWAKLAGNDRFKKGINIAISNVNNKYGNIRPSELILEVYGKMMQFIDEDEYKAHGAISMNDKVDKLDSKDLTLSQNIDLVRKVSEKIKKALKN